MDVYEVIAKKVRERGMTKAELARRIGLDGELLRRSLKGERNINADEFVRLCRELDLGLHDFTEGE